MRTVIKNAKIVNPAGIILADILIDNGVITAIGRDFQADRDIDAHGQLVTPGGVDAHVHLQYHVGNYDTCDDFTNGMKAAVMGGTTTVIDFVEARPEEPLLAALMRRNDQARKVAPIDYGLHMSILPTDMGKLEQIPAVIKAGCPTFKHYMAYGFTLNDGQMYRSMQVIGRNNGLALVHAENWDIIQQLTADLINAGRTSATYHMFSRPAFLEAQAVQRALDTARLANCPVYVCHMTCDGDVEALLRHRRAGYKAWGETCTHYCYLNETAFDKLDMRAICSPPLRFEEERKAIARHIRQGHLHTVSTDHCPFTSKEKLEHTAFNQVPGGLSGIEERMMLMHALPAMTLERWVEVCCTLPAKIMGLQHKGLVSPGYDADLVIWENDPHTITASELHEKADWSPFEGFKVKIRPATVFCRGEIVANHGEYKGQPGYGRLVERFLDEEAVVEAPSNQASPQITTAEPKSHDQTENATEQGKKATEPDTAMPAPQVPQLADLPPAKMMPVFNVATRSRGEHSLRQVMIGLGWDAAQSNFVGKLLQRLGSNGHQNIDLDLSLLLLDRSGSPIAPATYECCLTYRNGTLCECMQHSGDNTTGEGTGYKEVITINLEQIPHRVAKLVVLVSIKDGDQRGQDFSLAGDTYVALADMLASQEVERHNLTPYKGMTGAVVMELVRNAACTGWEYNVLGKGLPKVNSVEDLLALYR